jgi:hypothetical protein
MRSRNAKNRQANENGRDYQSREAAKTRGQQGGVRLHESKIGEDDRGAQAGTKSDAGEGRQE